jgi:putative phosphoesterase
MQVKKEKIDIVICGHTHMPKIIKTKNLTMINPGSTYKSRDPRGQSYAIANVDKGEITFKIKYLK